MKIVKNLGHPVLLICVFLLLLIESEHFGGFYLLYIILALTSGSAFAILASVGIVLVLFGYKVKCSMHFRLKFLIEVSGLLLMVASLLVFFGVRDRLATFHFATPVLTFIIFGICAFSFMLTIIKGWFRGKA